MTFCCFLLIILFISCTHKETSSDQIQNIDSVSIAFSADTAYINSISRMVSGLAQAYPDSVLKAGRKTLQLSRAIEYDNGIGDAYLMLATAYFFKYSYDSALYYYGNAYKIYKRNENLKKMGKAQHGLSYTYSVTSNLGKAKEAMHKSK